MRGVLFNTNWIIRLLQLMDEDGNLLASFVPDPSFIFNAGPEFTGRS